MNRPTSVSAAAGEISTIRLIAYSLATILAIYFIAVGVMSTAVALGWTA